MTDSLGRKISFKNTIIIMTSNIGARQLKDFGQGIGFNTAAKKENVDNHSKGVIEKALKKAFSPEFLNRIDDVIVFNNLDKEDINKIIDIDYNFCKGYYSYLKSVRSKRNKPLSSSTIVDYFKKLTGVCEELKREGIINENPASKVKIDKAIHKAREWMTIDELQEAIKTPCDNIALKNFYLLSCFTGLRHKNVMKLKWKNYVIEGNKHFIKCKLVKTGKPIEIPLHLNGQKLLGDIGRMGAMLKGKIAIQSLTLHGERH
jgi:integrase